MQRRTILRTVSATGLWRLPVKGFLFPAFNDRASRSSIRVLYYSKKPEELQPDFIDKCARKRRSHLPQKIRRASFQTIISDTLGEDCDYEVVRNIHDNLNEMMEEAKETPEPLELGQTGNPKNLLAQKRRFPGTSRNFRLRSLRRPWSAKNRHYWPPILQAYKDFPD